MSGLNVHYPQPVRAALTLSLWLATTPALATPVATGAEGWLGTYQVADAGEALLDPRSCTACRVVASASEHLDLERLAPRGLREIDLAFVARAERPEALHLFVGVRGELEVWLDGARVARWTRWVDRVDERHVALPLSVGEHVVTLRARRLDDEDWTLRTRLLDTDFAPGAGEVALFVGSISEDAARTLAADAISVVEQRTLRGVDVTSLVAGPTRVGEGFARPVSTLVVGAVAGAPAVPVPLRFGDDEEALSPDRGVWPTRSREVPLGARGGLPMTLRVDEDRRAIGGGVAIDRPLLEALSELAEALADSHDVSPIARASSGWRLREGLRVVSAGDPDARWRGWLRDEARSVSRALREGRDPFAPTSGYQRLAHPSALDGTPQPFELFVPPGRPPRTGWPVLITLHGFKGNAGDYFRNTFGLERDWRGGESLDDHGRHGTPPRGAWGGLGPTPAHGPMIVIAPEARGQTHYRHAGEVDVMEALTAVRARHPVDARRLYVTGGSMGGTGAAYLPYRHPDVFAASAALAGYHDQRVRQDTHHEGLSGVERFLVAERSDVDWAENARQLPTLLVRGTRDRPLTWTRALATRLRELGYPFEHREPRLGHNVWTETYADGAIFTWLGRHTRHETPHRVRLRTGRERTASSYWVRDVVRAAPDRFAEVDAHVDDARLEVTTRDVASLVLDPPAGLVTSPLQVRIDGVELEGEAPLSLVRTAETWRVGELDRRGLKRAGVSGPIRDVYHDRLVFVVGTLDPRHTWMNRRVAAHWANPIGWDVAYPIVDDVDVTPAQIADATLVLVGGPRSNDLVARWRHELPIGIDDDAVVVGQTRHRGAEVGTVFVAPHPDVNERSVLVIAGTTPLGTWRAAFLPDLLPDWVVFDEGIENARGQWSCGGARRDDGSPNFAEPVPCAYRAHGFFDMAWRVR